MTEGNVMLKDWRIVAVVVGGRSRHLEILLPYLAAQNALVDRCDLWCNTDDAQDVLYLRRKAAEAPFFRVVEACEPVDVPAPLGAQPMFGSDRLSKLDGSVHQFFRYCTDPDTIYVRFDDDICWVSSDAITNLVRFRLENRQFPIVFANTINNSICSFIHQQIGCILLNEGNCTYESNDRVGRLSGPFAELAHETFLEKLEAGQANDFLFPMWVANQYEQMSSNCICWLGQDFGYFGGEVATADETWLASVYPKELQQPNAICGTALVSHFAYSTQRRWLEENTSLLSRYKAAAGQHGPLFA